MRLSLEFFDESADVRQLRDDTNELERIIETLPEAERLHTRHAALTLSPVSLPDLTSGLLEHYFALDRERLVATIEGADEEVIADEAHRGTLQLREDTHDGACFEVMLPLAPVVAAARRPVAA